MDSALLLATISLMTGLAAFFIVRYGHAPALLFRERQEQSYDRVFRRQLMLDIEPRTVFYMAMSGVAVTFLLLLLLTANLFIALVGGAAAYWLPTLVVRHLEQKRRKRLDGQLADSLTTLSAGTRAGLNLVQAIEMVERNHVGPVQQEFAQLLREYQMGMDLNQAMRNTSNRIGSPLYRLTFTAIEMHRVRGGDASESIDRIAEAVREIKKLEGKLDAITAQSRSQASMMAVMPLVFLVILYVIDPQGVRLLFTETIGRVILLVCGLMILAGFVWIRKIMQVEV